MQLNFLTHFLVNGELCTRVRVCRIGSVGTGLFPCCRVSRFEPIFKHLKNEPSVSPRNNEGIMMFTYLDFIRQCHNGVVRFYEANALTREYYLLREEDDL